MSFEDEVRNAFARADAAVERVPLDWTATFEKARRGRRIYLAAIAVGAAAVLAAGAVGATELLRGGGPGRGSDVAQSPTPDDHPDRDPSTPDPNNGTPTPTGNFILIVPSEGVESGECSAAKEADEISPLTEQDDLPEQVQRMRANIIHSAWNCDFDELAKLAKDLQFNFNNQATPDYADYWRDLEAEGTAFTAMLVRLLAFPHADYDDELFVWPSAYGPNATNADFQLLVDLALYSQAEVDEMRRDFGGYAGARIGIRRNGDWQFYVEGGD